MGEGGGSGRGGGVGVGGLGGWHDSDGSKGGDSLRGSKVLEGTSHQLLHLASRSSPGKAAPTSRLLKCVLVSTCLVQINFCVCKQTCLV